MDENSPREIFSNVLEGEGRIVTRSVEFNKWLSVGLMIRKKASSSINMETPIAENYSLSI